MSAALHQPAFLAGPPGVGKTTIGREVARRLGGPFIDTDALIEARVAPAAELIEGAGESALRRAELEALEAIDARAPSVVALGGGTLTRSAALRRIRGLGPIISLTAPTDVIWARASSGLRRPLTRDRSAFEAVVERRAPSYSSTDASVPAEGSVDQVCDGVTRALESCAVVRVRVADVETRAVVTRGGASSLTGALRTLAPTRPVLLVEDEGVPEAARDAYAQAASLAGVVIRFPVPGGERVKTWSGLGALLEAGIEAGCGRQSVVVGLGGGATCDLAASAAGLIGRGAPLVLVPSTLLAQVDASIGGKAAVDSAHGKNLIGLFHPAREVITDLDLLVSLPSRERTAGVSELFKIALIEGGHLWAAVSRGRIEDTEVVARALRAKGRIVTADPFDTGGRMVLNLGHTVGHALEMASRFELLHGEAVSMGIALMTAWSRRRGLLDAAQAREIAAAQSSLGLPRAVPGGLMSQALPLLSRDKKGSAHAGVVVGVRGVGAVERIEVEWASLERELAEAEEEL